MSNVLAFRQPDTVRPEATGKGFALMHRKIMDLPFYRTDSEAVHLWFHFILIANHAPAIINTELGDVMVRRGEFMTGRNKLELATGITGNRIKYLIGKFEKLGMITKSTTKKFSLIYVTKYDEYQPNIVPTDYQQSANAKPLTPSAGEEVVPTDYQQSATNNEFKDLLISKDIKCATVGEDLETEKPTDAKQKISCEEVWQCLKDELPEARSWRVMDDDRRNLIKRFWAKANKIARQMDNGQPLTMQGFREYLQYISENCRWMLEDRPDNRSGKTWRRMKFDSFLSEKLYRDVREGDKDDR
ncbi:TPA: DNA replication protein [Yersinia enterocolitica]|nr:DNA replication protein [Yersinia enterocolitica]HDW3097625.1 DNA replication protein [Yersinia enterocolitica]HEN3438773.1 DNA replication protein [Yersinia enterocolitica]